MSAGKEELRRLAYLTRLELTPAEEDEMIEHLNKMLSYVEKLKELNTEGIEPTAHAVDVPSPMREDVVTNQPDTDNLLRNAPDREGDFLKVPRIIESGTMCPAPVDAPIPSEVYTPRNSSKGGTMDQFHTDRDQKFIDLAATLAGEFAPRAAQHDEEASFPYENYARLRESGYTTLTIPEELGGLGATLLQRIKAQERLAQGCGATSLAINMHFNVLGLLIALWEKFKDPKIAAKIQKVAKERLICGGSGSEPDNAVIILRPRTTAKRVDGGWIVNGRKIFSTQSIAIDLYFSEATWEDAPQGPTILTFFIPPRDTPGLIFKDDWYTMGMRASASRSSELKEAFIPDDTVVLQRSATKRSEISGVFLRAPFTIGAPYIGIAVAARNFVVDFMRDRPRYPLKKPMSHLPSVYNKVGEMDMLIETARAMMWKAAAEVEVENPRTWARKSVAARMVAIENSVRVVDLALRTVGGSSYFKRLPLERYHRDVRAGLFHPFDSDETLEFLGKSAFGIPMTEDDNGLL